MSEEIDTQELAESIFESIAEEYQGEEVTQDMVEDRVEEFSVKMRGLPETELRRAVVSKLTSDAGVSRSDLMGSEESSGSSGSQSNETVSLENATKMGGEEWVSVEVRVVEVDNDVDSEAISQRGALGDETGTLGFVSWSKSELPLLEEGESYRIENVVTDEYQGAVNSVKLNSSTEITELEEDIDAETNEVEFTANLVDLSENSGFVEVETDDDDGDPEHDLQLIATFDDGVDTYPVVIEEDLTEKMTGIGLEEAREMAMDHMDKTVVREAMVERVVGRYYTVRGRKRRNSEYIDAESVELCGSNEFDEDLLVRARSM